MVAADGSDVLVVVAKLAFRFAPSGELSLDYAAVRLGDELDDDGCLVGPSDVEREMPGTDVAVTGTAMPPGTDLRSFRASVRVGPLHKEVVVFGPRTYESAGSSIRPGRSEHAVPVALDYRSCFGGTSADGTSRHSANPVGRGFEVEPSRNVGRPAHVLEPLGGDPTQGCFAPIARGWSPRRERTGTHDTAWSDERAPLPPIDRDPRFASHAVDALYSRETLATHLDIELSCVGRPGTTRIRTPAYPVRVRYRVGRTWLEASVPLRAIFIDADEGRLELVSRASVALPRRWSTLAELSVGADAVMPRDIVERAEAAQAMEEP